jgi:hypothetical protein
MWAYAAGICKKSDILVLAVGGMEDHIHLLVQIPPTLPVAKGELRSGRTQIDSWQPTCAHPMTGYNTSASMEHDGNK